MPSHPASRRCRPCAIGMRFNPYGAAPMANPKDVRQAMTATIRASAGLGAAWYIAYYAQFARAGRLGCARRPHRSVGIVHGKPGMAAGVVRRGGRIYPVFHVLRGLSRLTGESCRGRDRCARQVQGIAVERDGKREVWLAT